MNGHCSYQAIAASYFKHRLQHKNPKPDPLNPQPDPMNRRDFLTASGLVAISAAAPTPSAATAQTPSAEGAGLESTLNKALEVAKDAQSNASAVAEAVLVTSNGALDLSPAKWLWYPRDRVLLNNSIEEFYDGSKRPDRVFGKGQLGARTLSLNLPPKAAGEPVVHRDERLALTLIAPGRFALPVDQTVNIDLKYTSTNFKRLDHETHNHIPRGDVACAVGCSPCCRCATQTTQPCHYLHRRHGLCRHRCIRL